MKPVRARTPSPANDQKSLQSPLQRYGRAVFISLSKNNLKNSHPFTLGVMFIVGFAAGIAAPFMTEKMQHKSPAEIVVEAKKVDETAPAPTRKTIQLTAVSDKIAAQYNPAPAPTTSIMLPSDGWGEMVSDMPDILLHNDGDLLASAATHAAQHAVKIDNAEQIVSDISAPVAIPFSLPVADDKDSKNAAAIRWARAGTAEAQAALQTLADENPSDPKITAALGHVLLHRKHYTAAEPVLEKAIRLDADNLTYRLDLAALYDHTKRTGQALALYRSILYAAADTVVDTRLPLAAVRARAHYLASLTVEE